MNRWIICLVLLPIAIATYLRRKASMFAKLPMRVRCSGGNIEVEERQGRWN